MSNGDGTWSPVAAGVLPAGMGLGIHAVDFDGDGRPDLLSIYPTSTGDVSYRSYFNRTPRTVPTGASRAADRDQCHRNGRHVADHVDIWRRSASNGASARFLRRQCGGGEPERCSGHHGVDPDSCRDRGGLLGACHAVERCDARSAVFPVRVYDWQLTRRRRMHGRACVAPRDGFDRGRHGDGQLASGAGATSYIISAGSTQGASNVSPPTNVGSNTTVSAAGLPPGFSAWVRVISANACGQSPPADFFLSATPTPEPVWIFQHLDIASTAHHGDATRVCSSRFSVRDSTGCAIA